MTWLVAMKRKWAARMLAYKSLGDCYWHIGLFERSSEPNAGNMYCMATCEVLQIWDGQVTVLGRSLDGQCAFQVFRRGGKRTSSYSQLPAKVPTVATSWCLSVPYWISVALHWQMKILEAVYPWIRGIETSTGFGIMWEPWDQEAMGTPEPSGQEFPRWSLPTNKFLAKRGL